MSNSNYNYIAEWLNTSHSKEDNNKLVNKLIQNEDAFVILLKLILKIKPEQASRGTWVLRNWASQNNKLAKTHQLKIINILEKSDNDSVLRNLSGIFVDYGIPEKLEVRILNLCFRLLIEKKRAVAVHANALTLLHQLNKKYPEFKQEIGIIITDHPNSGKASFYAGVKRFQFSRENIV